MRQEPFYFHNGRTARTVADLLQIIEESDQQVFEEHVRQEHNDFASWVQLSLHEEALASQMRRATDRLGTILALRGWLKQHPLKAHPSFMEKPMQREFLFGLLVGILIGIILLRIIQVIV